MGPQKARKTRPTYHYFYGSTDETPPSPQVSEGDVLFGESLVQTDNEEDTPNSSSRNLQQLIITTSPGGTLYQPSEGEPLTKTAIRRSARNKKGWLSSFSDAFLNIGGSHRIGHVTRVVVLIVMMLMMCTLIMVVKPRPVASATGAINGGPTPPLHITFPVVDRAEYGDPASNIINAALFDPNLLFVAGKINAATGASLRSNTNVDPVLKVPFPTGAFWTNLVMNPAANGFSFPIVSYPYAFQWSENVLQVSYPAFRRRVDAISIRDIFEPELSFGVVEQTSKRHITRFDPLSVTLRFYTTGRGGDGYWESYLVHGSPYITAKYMNTKPSLKALSTFQRIMCPYDVQGTSDDGDNNVIDGTSRSLKWAVCTPSEGSSDPGSMILRGVQFLIQTQEGMNWILFSSGLIELSFDSRIRTEIVATKNFSGVLRLAFIPPPAATDKTVTGGDSTVELLRLSESSGVKKLVYHAGTYPTGGGVSWDIKTASLASPSIATSALKAITNTITSTDKGKTGTVYFKFETQVMNTNSNSKVELLMLGLPHHADVLSINSMLSRTQFDLDFWSIKGKMVPVVGATWSYDEKLTDTQFDRVAEVNVTLDVANLLLQNIKVDMDLFPTVKTLNIYGYGKQVARLAQLAHIAKMVTKQSNMTSGILREITDTLYDSLAALLDGKIADELLYDAKFGGIVSKNGLLNVNEDFGNGRYNDHHFHYGYLLYASAVLGSLNSTFVEQHGAAVDSLLYDIAYKGNGDSLSVDNVFFPLARYKSWYDGHSFAAGLFQQGNGKSQESSSEAINGYYGAYLWAMVKHTITETDLSADFRDYLRLLLATEIRGAKSYWQMLPPSSTTRTGLQRYDTSFTKNYMVGNLGMLDAVCSTYFAKELFYVHLINILPITAITPEVFGEAYVEEQYPNVIAKAEIPTPWKGYAICNQAIFDPLAAWEQAVTLVSAQLDSGISKSQVLYFISTLQGFQPPKPIHSAGADTGGNGLPTAKSSLEPSSSSACQNHPNCNGLIGLCCPTGEGIVLECCQ